MRSNGFTAKYKTAVFKKGSLLALTISAAVVIVIALNILVTLIPTKYTRLDTTKQGLFSISQQTKTVLKSLEDAVNIYHLCSGAIEDENISELLLKYAEVSDKISVSIIDTSLYPNFYKDYSEDSPSDNSLIVTSKNKSRVIDFYEIYAASSGEYEYYGYYDIFNGESALTSAIDYVCTENAPKIYTLEGHAEDTLSSELQKEIYNQNFTLESLSLNGLEAVPDDADCVMLFSPERDISEAEMNMLSDYQKSGGNLIIISDYDTEKTPFLDKLLESFGLTVAEGIVFEGDGNSYIASYPYYIYPKLISNTITEPLISSSLHTLFPLAQGILIDESAIEGLTVETLVAPSDMAYSKIDINSENQERTDEDITGPFSFGVTVSDENGRLVLFSTSQFLDSNINKSVAGANYDLFLNSLAWLCQKENSISIHPKNLMSASIAVGSLASSIMFVVLVIAIPGIIILTAYIVMKKRRQK